MAQPQGQMLQIGIELAQKAIVLDTNHQYKEAVQEYNAAINCFTEVLNDPACSEQKRNIITQKIQEYNSRVILLLEAINNAPSSPRQENIAEPEVKHEPQPIQREPEPLPIQSIPQEHQQQQVYQPVQEQPVQAQYQHAPEPVQTFQPQYAMPQPDFQPSPHPEPLHPQASIPQMSAPPAQPNTPFFLSTPTGLAPLLPEVAALIDPLLIEYAAKHPKEAGNLQAAITLGDKAKDADLKKNYQAALDLYCDVVERFAICAAKETNPAIQATLAPALAAYRERSEKIKAVLGLRPNTIVYIAPKQEPLDAFPQTPTHIQSTDPSGQQMSSSGHGGPLTVKRSAKLLRGTLSIEATIKNNVVSQGDSLTVSVYIDNRSSNVVNSIKAKFTRMVGKTKTILSKQEYFQGSIFPLQAENSYRGDIVFPIPQGKNVFLPRTACVFYLQVEADISLKTNLKVKMPLILPS